MLVLGCAVTVLWLLGLGFVVFVNFDKAIALELNAWGDFLAGGFAPLAFFWLVIGYFQQGKELALNRKTLSLQVEELKNSVEQQRELALVAKEEVKILISEQERKYRYDKLRAQPDFRFSRFSDGWGDNNYMAYFTFSNVGANIQHLYATLIRCKVRCVISYGEFNSAWDSGEEHTFIMLFSDYEQYRSVEEIVVGVCFVDNIGEKVRQALYISFDHNGGVVLSKGEWQGQDS
jgi:hypothetical protein